MNYKIIIITLIIFFINEYFFKDRLILMLGTLHKYFKTFLIILAIVTLYFSLRKEDSIIGKMVALNKINLNNPLKNISEILQENLPQITKKSTEKFNNKKNLQKTHKRSVSETKKKVVAHKQDWKCKQCKQKLPASFEVHHVKPLFNGGTNEIENLVALCRNCHGNETVNELIKD